MTKWLLVLTRWRVVLAFMVVLAFTAVSVFISHGASPSVTFFGCLTPGGTLVQIGFTSQPCPGDTTPVFWNQTGPAGPTGATGPAGPPGPAGGGAALKTATTCSPSPPGLCSVLVASTGVTNILSLSITAPAAGFVYVTATGNCSLFSNSGTVAWGYVIGTSATEAPSGPEPQFLFSGGTSAAAVPLVVDRVFSVSAGANTFYLNVQQSVNSSLASCGGRMTVFFTTTMLP